MRLTGWHRVALALAVLLGPAGGCVGRRSPGEPAAPVPASARHHGGAASELAAARLNLGMHYKALGRSAEAIAEFREAARLDPALAAAATIDIGGVYEDLGQWHEAVAAFREAVRLEPASAPAHYALGRAALIAGDRARAEREYETLRALDAVWAERLRGLLAP